jgi:hypothetical protein
MLVAPAAQATIIPAISTMLFRYSGLDEAWKQVIRTHLNHLKLNRKAQLIVGNSGSGKTQLMTSYERCFGKQQGDEAVYNPVLIVEIQENTQTPINLLEQIITAMGATPVSDTRGNKLRTQCKTLLKAHRVEMLMLDEAQHTLPEKEGSKGLRMVNFFKEMIDHFDVAIVFFGTKKALRIQHFGQDGEKPIDDEQLSGRMFPPIELIAIKPQTSKWFECVNFFLKKYNLPTLTTEDSDLVRRIYLAQRYKTFRTLTTLFDEHDFSGVKNKNELILELKQSYQENLIHFGANPFDTEVFDETTVESLIVDIRQKMDAAV